MLQIISAYICLLVTAIGLYLFARIVLNEKPKTSKKNLILSIITVSIINTVIFLNLNGTIKTILMWFINIFFCKYLFSLQLKKSIFLTFIYTIILIITELISILLITKVFKINRVIFYNSYAGSIISNIITCFIFVLVTCLFRMLLRKLINTKVENNLQVIIFSILIAICTLMLFYTLIKEFRFDDNVLTYLIEIIVLLTVLFSLIRQTIENNKLIKKYDKLLEFMTTYENEIEKQRVLRHETKNEFLSIRGKIHDKQNNKEIIAYIDEILKEKIEVKQEEYAKFGYLPANGIKGLCYLKTQEAQDKGLNTAINISKRIKNSNIYGLDIKEQRDLGKILGVFLDNAIEASLKSKAKEFGIESYLNLDKQCQIIIANSYDEKIDLDKIGKEKFSTKGKNRGHGLLLVKHIVGNNNIFETKTDIINGLYIQTVTITKVVTKNQTKKKPSTKGSSKLRGPENHISKF